MNQYLRHSGAAALYFLLAGVSHRFQYLELGVSVVLVFVGAKMLLVDIYKIPVTISLGTIALVLSTCVGASLKRHHPEDAK